MPFARLEGDKLVIESRHKGEVHVNEISVGALGALGGQRSHARVAAYADS